jgi:hypothetical protein
MLFLTNSQYNSFHSSYEVLARSNPQPDLPNKLKGDIINGEDSRQAIVVEKKTILPRRKVL